MHSQANVKALRELFIETGAWISAAEGYPNIYKKARKQYGQLLKIEQHFNLAMRQYFADLPRRLVNKINWQRYQIEVMAYDIQVDITDGDWQNEQDLMLTTTYPQIYAAAQAGVAASDAIYGQGVSVSSAAIQERAANHALELVKGLNDTTKADAKRAIETSLKLHESYTDAAARLADILDSSYRAEMIARTETVKAYQGGVLDYGISAGAVSKTWLVSSNPCNICEFMSNQTVAINDSFSGGEDSPPQHPNCRCGLQLNYAIDNVPLD